MEVDSESRVFNLNRRNLLLSQNCTKGFGFNKNKQNYNELSVNMSLTPVKPLQILYENPQRQPHEISYGTRLGVALVLEIRICKIA
jgi:hypothetical protein